MSEELNNAENEEGKENPNPEEDEENLKNKGIIADAEKIIDISEEYKIIQQMNPKDVYNKKNQAIDEADIPLEEKLKYYDQNHDKMMADDATAVETYEKLMETKLSGFGKGLSICCVGAAIFYATYRCIKDGEAEGFKVVKGLCDLTDSIAKA